MEQPRIVTLTPETLAQEHICCAISARDDHAGIRSKKEWLGSRMAEGLKFVKLDARGKVFVEYIPAENGWMPVDAPGYTLINCLWVSGSFKGKGHGRRLLDACERDAAGSGSRGVIVVVGRKKKPFLSDKAFFLRHGYEVCDTAAPWFELLVKRFDGDSPLPQFRSGAKEGVMPEQVQGVDIFYTHQCPFNAPYIELLRTEIERSAHPVRIHHISSRRQAQAHCCPVTTCSVFLNGRFHTNEVLTVDKLTKIVQLL